MNKKGNRIGASVLTALVLLAGLSTVSGSAALGESSFLVKSQDSADPQITKIVGMAPAPDAGGGEIETPDPTTPPTTTPEAPQPSVDCTTVASRVGSLNKGNGGEYAEIVAFRTPTDLNGYCDWLGDAQREGATISFSKPAITLSGGYSTTDGDYENFSNIYIGQVATIEALYAKPKLTAGSNLYQNFHSEDWKNNAATWVFNSEDKLKNFTFVTIEEPKAVAQSAIITEWKKRGLPSEIAGASSIDLYSIHLEYTITATYPDGTKKPTGTRPNGQPITTLSFNYSAPLGAW